MDWMPQAIREGIFTILFISGPLVVLAAGLGLTIGVIQAATQVQEQTLGSAVKIIGLFLALIIFGFYMFQYMSKYAAENVERAFKLVPTLGQKALPRRNFLEIPKDASREPINTAELIETEPHESKGKKNLAGLDEPDLVTKNENFKPERLKPPQSARRENKDIKAVKKQELTIKKAEPPQSKPPAAKPAINTQQPSSVPTALRPDELRMERSSPAPVVNEAPKPPPKRLRRSSISDRLNKIKEAGI